MLEMDDAGWGSLVGPTIVGVRRVETNEFVWEELPMAAFQGSACAHKVYLDEAVEAAQRALARLNAQPGAEPIAVCQGYVLSRVRRQLTATGWDVRAVRIVGPLQEQVEAAFAVRLEEITGLALEAEVLAAPPRLFYACLKWLKGGDANACAAPPERAQWAKTGWRSYHNWVHLPYHEARQLSHQRRQARGQGR